MPTVVIPQQKAQESVSPPTTTSTPQQSSPGLTNSTPATGAAQQGQPQFASLYVGDLKPDVTEAILYETFNSVGPVASIRVCRDAITRKSLGYAYVNFHNVADAERALDTLNYSAIRGKPCRIMWSHRDPTLRKSGSANIFVKNLDKSIDNKSLYDTFSMFGNILSCKVATDENGKSRGYGFVHFEGEEFAKKAVDKLNGMMIGAKPVYVGPFMKQGERHEDGDESSKRFTNVYIKHMPTDWNNENKIREVFLQYGEITSICVREDNKQRVFAFVNFADMESAAKAVEDLHMRDLRTDEQIANKEGEPAEGEEVPEFPEYKIYCQRAMSKFERMAVLKAKFEPKAKTAAAASAAQCNLYVKNLPENVDDEQLKEMFQEFGNISSPKVMRDPATGVSRGFGFVCFENPEDAEKAIQDMHLKLIAGKPLYVAVAEKREARIERLQQRYRTGIPVGGFQAPQHAQGFPRGPRQQHQQPQPMYYSAPQQQPPRMQMPQTMQPPFNQQFRGPGMQAMQRGPLGGYGMQQAPRQGPRQQPMMPGMQPRIQQMPAGAMQRQGLMQGQYPMGAQPQLQPGPSTSLTAAALAANPPAMQKQILGEQIFDKIKKIQPNLAGKITGMMLEMDNSELLVLLESEAQMQHKVEEAVRVLSATQM